NEELQSTNSELETINQELQSTNDEMADINAELNQRSGDFDRTNRFLEAIFASLRGGVAVIDPQLTIKVWNRRAEDLWGVRAEEVIDTPLPNIDIGLPATQLKDIVLTTLNDGGQSHIRLIPAVNRRGKKIMCRVVATPVLGQGSSASLGAIVMMEEMPAESAP
ncbi:MAG TPA: PAS domain-containing protein, partial [Gemmatimonadaceae bacterium]|nr:PAS domain-containing protein [Gemmatimonadaceae bacterium]